MKIIKTILTCIASFFITLFGILCWLLQSILQLLAVTLILSLVAVLLVYARVKPDLDHCRQVAYNKLAQMERQDFRMLSDTEIYDKDGNLAEIGRAHV